MPESDFRYSIGPSGDQVRLCFSNSEEWTPVSMDLEPHSTHRSDDEFEYLFPAKRPSTSGNAVLGEKASKKILEWKPNSFNDFKLHPDFKTEFPELYWSKTRFDDVVSVAWDDATRQWNKLDFRSMIRDRFDNIKSFDNFFSGPYYAPEYSANLIARLLLSQYQNVDRCKEFVERVISIVDKSEPKVNTLFLLAPPSSGKTFFLNSLLDLIWNVGHIRNPKKGRDTFCFEDGISRRANEWNECIIVGSDFIETSKMIWEGALTPINVKYRSKQLINRTPLLAAGNKVPWGLTPTESKAFKDRCYFETWSAQPWLNEVSFYPCPAAWFYILENYQRDEWWHLIPSEKFFDDKSKKVIFDRYFYL